ncbi:MAG: rRNA maturation RNase YbeY [Oscillospiraceae bacterium]
MLLTNDDGIHAINLASRQVDRPTDVLSFPMFRLTPEHLPRDWSDYLDPETGLCPLGDMAISLERARAQAVEFGHSVRREVGYLTIHSMLHLLGYDHLDEGPQKTQMRAHEEAVIRAIDLHR